MASLLAPAPCFPPISLVAPSGYFLLYPSLKCSNSLCSISSSNSHALLGLSHLHTPLTDDSVSVFPASPDIPELSYFPPKLLFFLGPYLRDSPTIPTRALGLILEAPLPATLQLNGLFTKPPCLYPICPSAIPQGPALVDLGPLNPTMAVFLVPWASILGPLNPSLIWQLEAYS